MLRERLCVKLFGCVFDCVSRGTMRDTRLKAAPDDVIAILLSPSFPARRCELRYIQGTGTRRLMLRLRLLGGSADSFQTAVSRYLIWVFFEILPLVYGFPFSLECLFLDKLCQDLLLSACGRRR